MRQEWGKKYLHPKSKQNIFEDGYVYLVYLLDKKAFKVGSTINPEQRLKELGSPVQVIHIHPSHCMRQLEDYFHDIYLKSKLPRQSDHYLLNQEQIDLFKCFDVLSFDCNVNHYQI